MALVLLAFLLFRHYQKRRQVRPGPGYGDMTTADNWPLAGAPGVWRTEIDGEQKHELTGGPVVPQDATQHMVPSQPTQRMELDAASPERNRFHELNMDG